MIAKTLDLSHDRVNTLKMLVHDNATMKQVKSEYDLTLQMFFASEIREQYKELHKIVVLKYLMVLIVEGLIYC